MRNRSCFYLLKFLLFSLIVITALLNPFLCFAEETYVFERMWPTLQQDWYFHHPVGLAVDSHENIYVSHGGERKIRKYTLDGKLITKYGKWNGGDVPIEDDEICWPGGMATDRLDNVYICDQHCNRVHKYSSDGKLIDSWGNFGIGDGEFSHPVDVAIDIYGNVYVTDAGNHRIQKFTSDGQFITKWGGIGNNDSQFISPCGIAIDKLNRVFVVDMENNRIQVFNLDGQFLFKWGEKGGEDGYLSCPYGIAVDSVGNIYITEGGDFDEGNICVDEATQRVQKFTPDGQFITKWGGHGTEDGKFFFPQGITVSKSGIVFVVDSRWWRIQFFSSDGTFLGKWGASGSNDGELFYPNEIEIDPYGNVVVVDSYNSRIQKYTHEGQLLSIIDFEGNSGSLAVDADGNIYTSINTPIWKLAPDGTPITSWGGLETEYGPLTGSIAVDLNGNVYVVGDNFQIQKFRPVENASGGYDYEFETKWGSEGTAPGQFQNISGIAVGPDGNIYVADNGNYESNSNQRIQKFTPQGIFVPPAIETLYPEGIGFDPQGYMYVINIGGSISKYTPDGQLTIMWGGAGAEPGLMDYPGDITVGPNGFVYVVDSYNSRIQVFKKVETVSNEKAIIVSGGGSYQGNNLWDSTQMCANFAYRTLTYQGFTKESIHYLTSDIDLDLDNNGTPDDVDGEVTNDNLQQAITQWATDAASLVVYLVDHGGSGTFRMSGEEVLTASELDAWLDQLQETITGKVVVVYDACESGSFISQLTPPEGKERIVIGSTKPGESAYFVTQGSVSFSSFFWTHIFNGMNVKEAFDLASASISNATDFQHPILNDNGNDVGNEVEDGLLAQNTFIGNGTVIHGDVPVIGNVSPAQTINDTNSAMLYAENVTDTEGVARVWAVIRPPTYSQQSTYNPVNELPSIDLMPVGENRWDGTWDNFNIPGTYHIAIYARDRIGNTSVPAITTVNVNNPLTRKAIVVAASWQSDKLWPAIQRNAQIAYNALKAQGYTEDDLYLMCDQDISGAVVDGLATTGNLTDVLSNWASSGTQDLILYIVANGNNRSFRINQNDSISSTDLDGLLDNLQAIIPGEVTVIYDACRSGSFIEDLNPPEGKDRICIASTSSDKPANFLSGGTVSFSQFFWSAITNGSYVYNAFVLGKNAMWYASVGEQTAYLDDNANGLGNEKTDGHIARYYRLGSGIMLAGDEPLIGSVSPEQSLLGDVSATIWAQGVTTTGIIDKVWAFISPPGASYTFPAEPVVDLPTVEFVYNEVTYQWEGSYDDLSVAGVYDVSIYAIDTNGNMSIPATTRIIQTLGPDIYEDDDTSATSKVIEINATDAQRHNFHDEGDADWIRFYGVAGESYEVKTENAESKCDTVIDLYDDKGNLIESRDDYIYAEGELLSWPCNKDGVYYVKITNYSAEDYGADTGYDLRAYHPVGGSSGMVLGQVINALGDPVSGAIVKSDIGGCSAITLPNGYFLIDLPVGSHNITAEATGFGLLSKSAVEVGAENHFTLMFALTSTSIADLNGDGKADLADVILSLKVLSGINSTDGIRADFTGSSADIGQNNTIGLEEAVYIMQSVSGLR